MQAGLVSLTLETTGNRPRTWVSTSARGKKALHKELDALRAIMAQVEDAEADAGSDRPSAGGRGVRNR